MRIAFAGTPEFARTALARLHGEGNAIALVLTQPDRPAGRGLRQAASPVKALALELGIEVVQPRGLRLDGRYAEDAAAAREAMLAAEVDALIVAAYGLILPPWLLALPALGGLNIHASLLPRWRGAAPIQRAMEAGDAETGVTIMQMDAGLDTGAMLLAEATPIGAADSAATLHDRLAGIGADLIVRVLRTLAAGPLAGTAQPAEGITYASKIDKREAVIDWREPAAVIERRLRAFDPFPGARSEIGGLVLTLWRARVGPAHAQPPGTVLAVGEGRLVVACGDGSLEIMELQRAGGRRLPVAEFLRGWQPPAGAAFALPPALAIQGMATSPALAGR